MMMHDVHVDTAKFELIRALVTEVLGDRCLRTFRQLEELLLFGCFLAVVKWLRWCLSTPAPLGDCYHP